MASPDITLGFVRATPTGILTLVLISTLLAGCKSSGLDLLGRDRRPVPIAPSPRPTVQAESVVQRANINARKIHDLRGEATLSVTQGSDENATQTVHGIDGRIAFREPNDFRLTFSKGIGPDSKRGDIGSNLEGCWFWVRDDSGQYRTCNYDEQGRSPLPAAFQPDWIRETLGLRQYEPSQAQLVRVSRRDGSTTQWVRVEETRQDALGQGYVKQTLFDPQGRIRRHDLMAADGQTLIARADISEDYQQLSLRNPEGATVDQVDFPKQVTMRWYQTEEAGAEPEQWLKLEFRFANAYSGFTQTVRVNQQRFPDGLFQEPTDEFRRMRLTRISLDNQIQQRQAIAANRGLPSLDDSGAGASTIRRSRPSPSLDVEIDLAEGESLPRQPGTGGSGFPFNDPGEAPGSEPGSLNGISAPLGGPARVVEPGLPQAPQANLGQQSSSRRTRFSSTFGHEH